jgi:hypothetical protein
MPTQLRKFEEAYATMTVAVYEPLILKWVSGWTLYNLADGITWRAVKGVHIEFDPNVNKVFSTAQLINIGGVRPKLPPPDSIPIIQPPAPTTTKVAVDLSGRPLPEGSVQRVELEGFPDAVSIGDVVYPQGVVKVHLPVENVESSEEQPPPSGGKRRKAGNPRVRLF